MADLTFTREEEVAQPSRKLKLTHSIEATRVKNAPHYQALMKTGLLLDDALAGIFWVALTFTR